MNDLIRVFAIMWTSKTCGPLVFKQLAWLWNRFWSLLE